MEEQIQGNQDLITFILGALQLLFPVAIFLMIRKRFLRRKAYNKDMEKSAAAFQKLRKDPLKVLQDLGTEINAADRGSAAESHDQVQESLDESSIKTALADEIAAFEQYRQGVLKKAKGGSNNTGLIMLIYSGVIVFFAGMKYFSSGDGFATFFIVMMGGGFGLFLFIGMKVVGGLFKLTKSYKSQEVYRHYYKTTVLPALLKVLNPSFQFNAEPMPLEDMDGIWSGGVPQHYNYYKSKQLHDILEGEIHGVRVMMGEMELSAEMDAITSQTKNENLNLLRALILKAEFNKNLQGNTLMIPDFQDYNELKNDRLISSLKETVMGQRDPSGERFDKLGRVSLESPDFERFFNVYSSDQVEARYIFTPGFMAQILALKKETKDAIIFLRFSQKKMTLNIHWRKNYFEPPSVNIPVGDGQFLAEAIREIHELSRLVEILGLNKTLWAYEE